MQAQNKKQPTTARAAAAPDSSAILVRTLLAVIATVLLLFVLQPSVVRAQEKTAPHTVVAGESLWSLALQFYGDGQKWQELARLNGLGDNGEKQLVVGQSIKVPEHKPTAPAKTATTPPPNTPRNALQRALQPSRPATSDVAPEKSSGALAAQTAGKADAAPKAAPSSAKSNAAAQGASRATAAAPRSASAGSNTSGAAAGNAAAANAAAANAAAVPVPVATPASEPVKLAEPIAASASRIWAVDLPGLRDARGAEQSTIFLGPTYNAASADSAVKAAAPSNARRERAGEYSSAPYALDAKSLTTAGAVGRRAGTAGGSFKSIDRLVLVDEAEVTLPAGTNAVPGARFVSVQTAELLANGAQVVVPTGVFQVVRADAGRVIARVVRQSGTINEGQPLIPLEGTGLANGSVAKPVVGASGAPSTSVTWVDGSLLPSLQSYLLLGVGEREGVKAGDEFALVAPRAAGNLAAESRIALVRVVRVTPFGSSAIVVKQDQPSIALGSAARLVARVP